MTRTRSLVLALPASLLIAGCGGSDDPGELADAGPAAADGGDVSEPDAAPPAPTGRGLVEILFEPPPFAGGYASTRVRGGFTAEPGTICDIELHGACEVTRCPKNQRDPLLAPGRLHIGPLYYGGAYSWDPGAYPLSFLVDEIAWAANEAITVSTEGEDLTAFALETASPATLDAGYDGPIFDQPLDRTEDLAVTWMPQPGRALVRLEQEYNDDSDVVIDCDVSATAGQLRIPAAALARLDAVADGGRTARLTVRGARAATAVVGELEVTVRALRGFSDHVIRYTVE